MPFPGPLIECTFLRRYQRFFADVRLPGGELVTAHCANTGAMTNCQPAGGRAWISDSGNPKRKLRYTLEIVEVDGARICVNTHRANRVVAAALAADAIPELVGYATVQPERRHGDARFDFVLWRPDARAVVEVKSATLGVGGGITRFPDAVSERARRHVEALADLARAGERAVLLFCAMRDDTRRIEPADEVDPAYGRALRAAAGAGVELLGYRCDVSPDGVRLRDRVPVVT